MRQVNNVKASQEHELQAIEEAQKAQFVEFSEAWDKYMNDYEATALKSLEKLKVAERVSRRRRRSTCWSSKKRARKSAKTSNLR
jgi:hypothetical protein